MALQTVTASCVDICLCNVNMKQCSPEIISVHSSMALTATQHMKLGRGRFFLPNDGIQSDLTHVNIVPLQLSGFQWRTS